MTENFVILPSDTSNTGKLVRTNQRTVGGSNVEEHFTIIQDYTNNFQAQVISGPATAVTGLAFYAVQAGSYNTYGTITTGSEQYIKGGSIQTYNPIGIGSVRLAEQGVILGVSGTLFAISGIVNQGTNPWVISGLISNRVAGSIVNMPIVGVSGTLFAVSGTVTVDNRVGGSIVNLPVGSMVLYGSSGADIGIYPLGVNSGTIAVLQVDVTGTTVISGIVNIGIGSVNVAGWPGSLAISNFAALGSNAIVTAGSIRLLSTPGSVAVFSDSALAISGVVNQGTTPWATSGVVNQGTSPWATSGIVNIGIGSVNVAGWPGSLAITNFAALGSNTVIKAGSVEVYDIKPLAVEQDRGVFVWSGVSFIGSSTGSNVITPGAGSKLFLKGFTATADISTKFGLRFSGGTATFIGNFTLPASGTMTTNLMGFEPSGATDQPLMVNLYSAGSLDISLGVKQSL